MNAGMKDMLNVMSKLLALGVPLDDVVRRATWNPAREVKQESIGHLSVGAIGRHCRAARRDRAGSDSSTRMVPASAGSTRLVCELTLRDGNVVFDLNGLTKPDWETLPPDYGSTPSP